MCGRRGGDERLGQNGSTESCTCERKKKALLEEAVVVKATLIEGQQRDPYLYGGRRLPRP